MKNKKSIYILLPIVLFIWGAVLYQFFSFSNNDSIEITNSNTTVKPFKIKPKDTFSIKINNRDPFLGKLVSNENNTTKTIKPTSKPKKIVEEVVWPQIGYKGIVSDNKEKIKVYMVIINGKTYLMKKGDEEEEIKLKDGDRETIYVIHKGDLKVVFIR